MELEKAIIGRRSTRKFLDKPVSDYHIKKIIEAATWAPSACNIQGWKFIVVKEKTLKEWLVKSGGPPFIQESPAGILVLYDSRGCNMEYMDYIQTGGAVIQNMLLTAHQSGIGTCWVCRLPSQQDVRKMFDVPKYYSVIAYIVLGYAKEQPNPIKRRHNVDDVMSNDTFKGIVTKESVKRKVKLLIPRPLKLFARMCLERFKK